MSNDHLSTRDYERVADASRRRLASSLDDLSRSLTPGRMLDEVMTYARGGGTDFFRGLGKAASANPIPTLLVSVGSIMFLSGKGRLGSTSSSNAPGRTNSRSGIGEFARDAAGSVQHGAESIGSAVGDATGRTASKLASAGSAAAGQVGRAADALRSAAASGAEKAKDAFETGAGALGDAASEAAETVADKTAYVRDETSALFEDLTERATTLAREQPLLVAAVGLAMGAMVAALLPRTDTEDAYLGEASDAVKGTVGEVAGEQYERAKSVAANVLDEAKTAAERQGLTPEAAADAVRDLGDRVKNVVSEVAGGKT